MTQNSQAPGPPTSSSRMPQEVSPIDFPELHPEKRQTISFQVISRRHLLDLDRSILTARSWQKGKVYDSSIMLQGVPYCEVLKPIPRYSLQFFLNPPSLRHHAIISLGYLLDHRSCAFTQDDPVSIPRGILAYPAVPAPDLWSLVCALCQDKKKRWEMDPAKSPERSAAAGAGTWHNAGSAMAPSGYKMGKNERVHGGSAVVTDHGNGS